MARRLTGETTAVFAWYRLSQPFLIEVAATYIARLYHDSTCVLLGGMGRGCVRCIEGPFGARIDEGSASSLVLLELSQVLYPSFT